jgi:hypothetical protein
VKRDGRDRRGDRAESARVGRAAGKPAPGSDRTANRIDALLDEGLAQTFPASDPVALPWRGGVAPEDI